MRSRRESCSFQIRCIHLNVNHVWNGMLPKTMRPIAALIRDKIIVIFKEIINVICTSKEIVSQSKLIFGFKETPYD